MDFPIVFSKCDLAGGDKFFHQIFFLRKPNTSECAQVLVVTRVKVDCVEALLSPDPTWSFENHLGSEDCGCVTLCTSL